MRIVRVVLVSLHVFVGLGALAGGSAAVLDPVAPLGVPASILEHSPFRTFLVPGIILFLVLGIGNLAAAACFLFRKRWQGYMSGAIASAIVAWIVVQCALLRSVVFLHALYFFLGAVMGCLSLALLAREGLWPGTWLASLMDRVSGKASAADD